MKKLIIALLFALPAAVMASEGGHYEKANIDLADKASLQRQAVRQLLPELPLGRIPAL